MEHDVRLTSYERRRWRQLQRQLEAVNPRRSGGRSVRWIVIGAMLLIVLGAVATGGLLGLAAAGTYFCVTLALWGLSRAIGKLGPPPSPMKDML